MLVCVKGFWQVGRELHGIHTAAVDSGEGELVVIDADEPYNAGSRLADLEVL